MANVKIDGKEYDYEKLSLEARQQLASLQFIDGEMARLQAQSAVLHTARAAYAKALNEALSPFAGDTIKFG